jgi:hypothetical protein
MCWAQFGIKFVTGEQAGFPIVEMVIWTIAFETIELEAVAANHEAPIPERMCGPKPRRVPASASREDRRRDARCHRSRLFQVGRTWRTHPTPICTSWGARDACNLASLKNCSPALLVLQYLFIWGAPSNRGGRLGKGQLCEFSSDEANLVDHEPMEVRGLAHPRG